MPSSDVDSLSDDSSNETVPESIFSWATATESSQTSDSPTLNICPPRSQIIPDAVITPLRVRMSTEEEVFIYTPAPGVVREETHRKRRRHVTVYRTRKGDTHIYEQALSRDFFLIITLCFVAACFLICLIRPYALFCITDAFP